MEYKSILAVIMLIFIIAGFILLRIRSKKK